MKSDIGILQEELPSGKVTTSSMRILSFCAFAMLGVIIYFENASYESHFDRFTQLMSDGKITESTYNTLLMQQTRFDQWLIVAFLVASFAPKAIQKLIEIYLGTKKNENT